MSAFKQGDRVWHRSFPDDCAGTVTAPDETVGGFPVAIVKWDDGSETATDRAALVPEARMDAGVLRP